jgi:hypothetical protein
MRSWRCTKADRQLHDADPSGVGANYPHRRATGARPKSLAETQPSLRHAFKHVYGFILQACDKAAADAIFEDYLAGKLSEKLLSISRRCVSADQAGSFKREVEEDWAA